MLDWTDRHCRYFHRLLSCQARLYTEMITTGALRYGDIPRHLQFHTAEHPLALQLGGSEPAELAYAARLAHQWGYDEVNLNCGCPSARVQRGAFGACLMNEAPLVSDCVKAMQDMVDIPITVKHRIGLGRCEDYSFVRDFVGTVAEAGCRVFIVHARNAWLEGLSPKENRDIPPLRYNIAQQLKRDFAHVTIVLNGGLRTDDMVHAQLQTLPDSRHHPVDGVMIGREAYHNPWWLARWDAQFFGMPAPEITREQIEQDMVAYMEREAATQGTHWYGIARHMLGLRNGLPGARRWRQTWSNHHLKHLAAREVMQQAAVYIAEP